MCIKNYFLKENRHWLIGNKYQNVGGFKSLEADLEHFPTEGWLYNDGHSWNDNDTTITVIGISKSAYLQGVPKMGE